MLTLKAVLLKLRGGPKIPMLVALNGFGGHRLDCNNQQ